MAVKILSIQVPNDPLYKKSFPQEEQEQQGLITKFEVVVNEFINSHPNATTAWLQSSAGASYGSPVTQLTVVITY